jgi:hypothetical protein
VFLGAEAGSDNSVSWGDGIGVVEVGVDDAGRGVNAGEADVDDSNDVIDGMDVVAARPHVSSSDSYLGTSSNSPAISAKFRPSNIAITTEHFQCSRVLRRIVGTLGGDMSTDHAGELGRTLIAD